MQGAMGSLWKLRNKKSVELYQLCLGVFVIWLDLGAVISGLWLSVPNISVSKSWSVILLKRLTTDCLQPHDYILVEFEPLFYFFLVLSEAAIQTGKVCMLNENNAHVVFIMLHLWKIFLVMWWEETMLWPCGL